jgi:FAD/FMN-containing dehydrogenase
MKPLTRRTLLAGTGVVAGAAGTRALIDTGIAIYPTYPKTSEASSLLNDASELSPVKVARHTQLTAQPDDAFVRQLRNLLEDAKAKGQPVVAHTARHSMGGQSLVQNGMALTFDQTWIVPDPAAGTYRVAAGTRWSTVIRELDAIGFSPKVMQSNNDFGVASTFSVNAHGWPVAFSGGGTTARSIKILLASGEHVTCSRTENPELFRAALGGYGLMGLITELEMEMVPNASLVPSFTTMPASEFGPAFEQAIRGSKTMQMAYGRMNVDIGNFLEDALMITYEPASDQSNIAKASGSGFISRVSRDIFRQQVGSERWKNFRWMLETDVNQLLNSGTTTRNSLLNEPVVTLDDGDPNRTDILHEYFIAPDRCAEFVQACRDVIRGSFQELLNITLRFVDTDQDSVLAYATTPRVAAVLLFSQEKTTRGEADMARMTTALIERVLELGGTYYLPYRPHATVDQFKRGYARHAEFAVLKRRFDPELLFRNGFWDYYVSKI